MSPLLPQEFPPWRFHNPVELNVGRGCRERLVERVSDSRILVVTTPRGRQQLEADSILSGFLEQNLITWTDTVSENPGLAYLQHEIVRLVASDFDAVVAFGGGSSMDAAKVINVATAPECRGVPLKQLIDEPAVHRQAKPTPLHTVSTTSGTGSEVTPFATVWDYDAKKKLSLAGPAVWPTAAYVDAALTDTVPTDATISTGLDAINQAFESTWNRSANPITLGYATRALQLGMPALLKLASGSGTPSDRNDMAEASLLAGLAISHTRTALCHSISYPLTMHFDVPHGLACAFTMPAVLRANLAADDGRFSNLAAALTGDSAHFGLVAWVDRLNAELAVAERVRNLVPSLDVLLALQGEMWTPGRADNNLVQIDSLDEVLRGAWAAEVA